MASLALHFRVNPGRTASPIEFELPFVDGESVADLKARVSERAGPHSSFFLLQVDQRPLKLVERIHPQLASSALTIDVLWDTCSHGAPAHPITGESSCFWDGGAPSSPVET